jgi:hypothetical protein
MSKRKINVGKKITKLRNLKTRTAEERICELKNRPVEHVKNKVWTGKNFKQYFKKEITKDIWDSAKKKSNRNII